VYRRLNFVASCVLTLCITVACAEPEADQAIFVQRESTTTDSANSTQSPRVPSTVEVPEADARVDDPAPTTAPETPTYNATTTTLKKRPWTLLAGGDVLLDLTEPEGVDPFTKVEPSLSSADVAIVNLEMAITERGEPYDKEFVFRAPGSAALTLAGAGIDVVSLANNHILDFGSVGLEDTISVLDEVGILRPGAGANNAEAYAPRVLVLDNEIRVAFVSASAIIPGGFSAGAERPGIADAKWAIPRVLAAVRAAASGNDVVVVSIHWGVERATCPSQDQRGLAQQLIEAGANLILGHHPHVLQPIETFDRTVIAYSLGNFAWHPRYGITGDTGVLEIFFDGPIVEGYQFHPHILDYLGGAMPVDSGDRYDRIIDIVEGRCEAHSPEPPTTTEVITDEDRDATTPTTEG
jgi:hypothetical protein|tara:strand:- start:2098 stop:3324 length:1227 start_codon:yes stop_codon:yes gene_type:complete